jgi:hypothetical protein
MFQRGLSETDILSVIKNGETISNYPEDEPCPSQLLLGFIGKKPVHVLVGVNEETDTCYVVTAYVPNESLWSDDYRTRKKS